MKLATQAPTSDIWRMEATIPIGVDTQDDTLLGAGRDLLRVIREWYRATQDYLAPASRNVETTDERLARLAAKWKAETMLTSSATDIAMHPAYQEIIGMGNDVVPLLLAELATEPDHWFWALKAITAVDPVPPADRGNVRRMTDAWLQWGRDQGCDVP